jgi:predicted metal-dependent hydrolase
MTVREQLFPRVRQIAGKNGFAIRDLMVKSQRTRWASCSSKKNLCLNTKLLFIPPDLVRYVITHELCHTVHMNHSAEFWRLVACHEPAYRVLDDALREAWKKVPAWAL